MLKRFSTSVNIFAGESKTEKAIGDDDLDTVLKDSEQFIKELKSSLQSNYFSPMKLLRGRIIAL